MKQSWVKFTYLGGLCAMTIFLLMLVPTKNEATNQLASTVTPRAAATATPQPGRAPSSLASTVTPTVATTATLSLAIDLNTVSSKDALGELSFYVGGGQAASDEYRCQDYRDFSFAQPTALGDGFHPRSLLGDLSSSFDDAPPVWDKGAGLVICGLEPNKPVQISLFDAEGKAIYAGKGQPKPILDELPNACTYSTSGLPQDFCYRVDEPMTVDILPWEPLGIYRVEVTQGDSSFEEEFRVDPPTEPMIYYSQRANGYVLAGFQPNEHVRIVRYEGAHPVGVAPLQLDEHGGGLLISAQLGIITTLGAVRDDLTIVSSGEDSPTVNFNALIKQNSSNALAYYGRARGEEGIPAVKDLNAAIALDPGFAVAYEERARKLSALGDGAHAMRDRNRAIELDPNSVSAHQARAAIYVAQKKWDLALADLSAVIDLQPSDITGVYEQRAEVYRSLGNYELAINDYRQIIASDPGRVSAYFELARLYSASGDDELSATTLKQAIQLAVAHDEVSRQGRDEDYSRMIELEPDWAFAYYARGLRRTGEESIPDLDKAIALVPDFAPAHRARAYKLSYLDLKQAIPAYAKVIELDPADRAACLEKAILEEATGDLAAAIQDYKKSYPYSPQAYQLRARLAENEGDLAMAIEDYSTLIEKLPNFLPALYQRGRLYELAGDSAKAIADYTQIIETAPNYAQTALYARARLYLGQGEVQLARASMIQALTLDDQLTEQYGTVEDYNLGIELLPDSALAYLRRGQWSLAKLEDVDGALADVTTALLLNPNNMPALKMRARILSDRDDPGETIIAFTDLINALDASAESGSARELYDAYSTRASLYGQLGQSEKAIADYTSAIELGARSWVPSYDEQLLDRRASLYEESGEYAKAIADYTHLISTSGDRSGTRRFALARIYEATGETDSTRAVLIEASEVLGAVPYEFTLDEYNRFVELAPEYAPAHLYRGKYFYDQAEYAGAIRDLTTAIELGSKEYLPRRESAYRLRGNAHYFIQDYERAIEDYSVELEHIRELERSLAMDLSADVDTAVADLIYRRGQAYYGAGSYQNAIEDLSSAISLAPDSAKAYYALAHSYDAIGDTDSVRAVLIEASEALGEVPSEFKLADYDRFVELAPKYAPAYLYRGTYFYGQNKYSQAIFDLTTSIELGLKENSPGRQSAYKLRGNAYYFLQDYGRAIEDYSVAIDLSDDNSTEVAGLLNYRGSIYYRAGRYQDAILDYTEAIGKQPENAIFYGNRGLALYVLGRYALAITDFSKAIDLAPYTNGYRYFRWRGDAYRKLGDTQNAIADYQTFIEKTDDQAAKGEVQKILAELKP